MYGAYCVECGPECVPQGWGIAMGAAAEGDRATPDIAHAKQIDETEQLRAEARQAPAQMADLDESDSDSAMPVIARWARIAMPLPTKEQETFTADKENAAAKRRKMRKGQITCT